VGILVYLKGNSNGVSFSSAQRLEWTAMPMQVITYGKTRKATELWCVLYDAREEGTELARFRGSEVIGFRSYR
jgi:hypothetical protein